MNKNSKNTKRGIAKAAKVGDTSYTSRNGKTFVVQPCQTDGVISASPKRNMAMRVYKNVDDKGKATSLTAHEPLRSNEYVTPKGHNYITYKQPRVQPRPA